jgi:hypothetical protein
MKHDWTRRSALKLRISDVSEDAPGSRRELLAAWRNAQLQSRSARVSRPRRNRRPEVSDPNLVPDHSLAGTAAFRRSAENRLKPALPEGNFHTGT